jgi:signal transduction histidine kinase/DNA-binding response OmpR family regulator/streptogramin lyase
LREIGIDLVYPKNNPFNNISYVPYKSNSIHNNNIRSIYFDESDTVWFGTENGISKLSPDGMWTNYNKNPDLANKAVLTINKYNNHLILGVYGSGLIKFNPETGKTDVFPLIEDNNKSKLIFATHVDKSEVWVGGIDGPVKHYQNGVLVTSYKTGNARSIISNNQDLIFVGSANGLKEINKRTKKIRPIKNKAIKNIPQIYSLCFDEINNCIWIGNTQGLLSYDLTTKEIKHLNKELNFESGTVFSIQKDANANLWLGSYSGLWKLNPKRGIIRKFDAADGLTIKSFGFGASTQSNTGRLAFGGPKGATLFSPKDLSSEKEDLKIYVSEFKINGVAPDATILDKNINFLDKIELNYNQNSLSFNFETPQLHGSKKQVFSWELKGYDNQPNLSKNSRQAVYSKLPAGSYSLETKVTNVDGVLSSEIYSIDVIIKQPFWLSNFAFLVYIFLGLVLGYLLILIKKSRADQKFNDNKIKFFTEVAHDIRTPVTLIQLLVSQLSEKNKFQNSIELIQRNTQNLNEYVTQLLDFQKADRGMLKLSVKKVDLKKIIHRTVAEFEPLLIEKSIDISLSVPKVYLWFDETKVSRIFYNLISNAIKYSEDGGQIEIKVLVNNKNVQIDFIDNGIGIPEDEHKLLFSRFTRGTNINNKGISGSGIGLMISKKIIELHGGTIEFKSKQNIGSTFSLTLKKGSEHYNEKDLFVKESEVLDSESIQEGITSNKTLLLVEDNEDLRATIKFELEKKYTVIDAPNGREALLIALSKNLDLIITDVMMPVMGGKELCNTIKTNFQTSHIPLIMITSLNDVDDKIEGLEIGADAYLEKPFNMKILNALIVNLLNSRQPITQISKSSLDPKQQVKSNDENFLSDIVEIIKMNITNSEFSIDLISEKTGLSRSKLFRKLKGLTNMSPVDLVIKIKLNHASELLKNNKTIRISEVAYASGFNDPKYFSTLFKKFFGKTPKEYSESF